MIEEPFTAKMNQSELENGNSKCHSNHSVKISIKISFKIIIINSIYIKFI